MAISHSGHYQLTIFSGAVKRIHTFHPEEGEVSPVIQAISHVQMPPTGSSIGLEGRAVQSYVDRMPATRNPAYVQDITSCSR